METNSLVHFHSPHLTLLLPSTKMCFLSVFPSHSDPQSPAVDIACHQESYLTGYNPTNDSLSCTLCQEGLYCQRGGQDQGLTPKLEQMPVGCSDCNVCPSASVSQSIVPVQNHCRFARMSMTLMQTTCTSQAAMPQQQLPAPRKFKLQKPSGSKSGPLQYSVVLH